MASSSSLASQRRRPLGKRQSLSRRNSSFLGSLKSIVTAPLAWFASTDDFEDSKDFQGKRRRLAGAPTEPVDRNDDKSARTKRMRIDSPPRDEPHSQPIASVHGYLDPPGSVFQPRQHHPSNPLIQPNFTRSFSATQPYDFNNNNNEFRASTMSRTMSIDPPIRSLSSAAMSVPLHRDTSLDVINFPRAVPRDLSMPPLSGRPSFLMRTSMTPQPRPLREVSEPPPINTLSSRPTFIHAPPMKPSESLPDGSSGQSSATLGSLVDSARRTRSPVRQHSSLLFGGSSVEHARSSPHPATVIEKALHELDIYKTPLVPTRLRSSNISTTATSSNLFKSRRASNLVLMQSDNISERLGRKSIGKKDLPTVNITKPYAGEGGMKKLLARRKQEADDENDEFPPDEDQMDDGSQTRHGKSAARSETVLAPGPLPSLHSRPDRSSTQSSSLRVGRTKSSRNHITRPARPQKMKFSAAFDEDAMDDGEELDEEAMQRKKEREALEEAVRHAPVFKIPEGFTFAKETKSIENDASEAKEPPIKSLPFSLVKPSAAPENPSPQQSSDNTFSSIAHSSGASVFGTTFQIPSAAVPSLAPPPPGRTPSPLPLTEPSENPPSALASAVAPPATNGVPNIFANSSALSKPPVEPKPSAGGVPNFFAKSSVLSKPVDLPPTAPLLFNTSSSTPTAPVKDVDNPLWEGESKKAAEPVSDGPSFTFGKHSGSESLTTTQLISSSNEVVGAPAAPSIAPSSLFGNSTESESTPTPSSILGITSAVAPALSFSKPAETFTTTVANDEIRNAQAIITPPVSSFGTSTPVSTGEPAKSPAPGLLFRSSMVGSESSKADFSAPAPFTFGQPVASTQSLETPKPLFGAVETPKPSLGVAGGFSFGSTAPKETEQKLASSPFSFGTTGAEQKSASTSFSFGSAGIKETEQKPPGSPFSFGNASIKEVQKPASSPFSFGAAPSTPPPAEATRSSSFSFGAPATSAAPPAPASVGFSFSSGSNGGDVSSKPFSFGQPSTIARPSTPPKSQEQEVNMDESPTRELQQQQTVKLSDRPTIGGGGFSFGSNAGASTFGAQSGGSSPFSFGAPTTTTGPFGKPAENNTTGFSFGQPAPASTGFVFGQNKADNESARPSTAGSFSFGAPTSVTGSAPVFAFGGPGNNSTGSNFGQSQAGSAPASPSTFAQQPSPFSFGSPLPPVSTGFPPFGSQPASPAGVNLSLPQPATPGGFGSTASSGFGQPQQPSSPFSGPTVAPPLPGGSALFTIGAAPAATAAPGGPRTIRKLPNRRGGAKR
ncbi:hypothetical protein H0H87_006070 [Tephrocybe sp. NHM501043]|nr:hypothetical protein H0H87_006070 [Tephrocybe sp. NHM501043]